VDSMKNVLNFTQQKLL